MVYTLNEIRELCKNPELPADAIQFIESQIPDAHYQGHMESDLCMTLFFQDARSSVTRSRKVIRVDTSWQDTSVIAAFLDFDEEGKPLCLDIV
jgi:hypothetical protein